MLSPRLNQLEPTFLMMWIFSHRRIRQFTYQSEDSDGGRKRIGNGKETSQLLNDAGESVLRGAGENVPIHAALLEFRNAMTHVPIFCQVRRSGFIQLPFDQAV